MVLPIANVIVSNVTCYVSCLFWGFCLFLEKKKKHKNIQGCCICQTKESLCTYVMEMHPWTLLTALQIHLFNILQ